MSQRDKDAAKTKAAADDGKQRREATRQVNEDNVRRREAERAASVPVKKRKR
jgi:hypothetical protein